MQMEEERQKNAMLSDFEKNERAQNNGMLEKAKKKLDEEMDDVKRMNQRRLYSTGGTHDAAATRTTALAPKGYGGNNTIQLDPNAQEPVVVHAHVVQVVGSKVKRPGRRRRQRLKAEAEKADQKAEMEEEKENSMGDEED